MTGAPIEDLRRRLAEAAGSDDLDAAIADLDTKLRELTERIDRVHSGIVRKLEAGGPARRGPAVPNEVS